MLVAVYKFLSVAFVLLSIAPMQCRGEPDHSLREYDGPGDALYDLAQDFRAKGNTQAYHSTLRFIISRYPSSRRAVSARLELEGDAGQGDAQVP